MTQISDRVRALIASQNVMAERAIRGRSSALSFSRPRPIAASLWSWSRTRSSSISSRACSGPGPAVSDGVALVFTMPISWATASSATRLPATILARRHSIEAPFGIVSPHAPRHIASRIYRHTLVCPRWRRHCLLRAAAEAPPEGEGGDREEAGDAGDGEGRADAEALGQRADHEGAEGRHAGEDHHGQA